MELETITVSHTLTPGILTTRTLKPQPDGSYKQEKIKITPNPALTLCKTPSATNGHSPRKEMRAYTTLAETTEEQIARLMPGGQFRF